jgi:hypothetical protein
MGFDRNQIRDQVSGLRAAVGYCSGRFDLGANLSGFKKKLKILT